MATDLSLPASRSIALLGVETPLLIPSFSSRGFPDEASLFEALQTDLYGVCLVSAFDVASKRLNVQFADVADMVVIDSGVYETTPTVIAADGYRPPAADAEWTRSSYRNLLRTVDATANALAVSFDHYGPIEEQVAHAREDFSYAITAATDFLLKPPALTIGIDLNFSPHHTLALATFDVVGVAERELGDSLLARCQMLVGLRRKFRDVGSQVAIHVFGTITPGAVLAYFLSGADVFDGLNWLRFAYTAEGLYPTAETALDEDQWDRSDEYRRLDQSRKNLRFLNRLQRAMRTYAKNGDLAALVAAFPVARSAARVARAAGSRFPGDGLE